MGKKKEKAEGSTSLESQIVVNGWAILAHPLFLAQVEKLVKTIEEERSRKSPRKNKVSTNTANEKLLAAILDSAFDRIPRNPADKQFRQGDTLGTDAKHWFRYKFFNGRFRLFFRYQSSAKAIVLAWVNDDQTLRTYGSNSDAYAVFRSMLETGKPPNTWDQLLAQAREKNEQHRVLRLSKRKRNADRT